MCFQHSQNCRAVVHCIFHPSFQLDCPKKLFQKPGYMWLPQANLTIRSKQCLHVLLKDYRHMQRRREKSAQMPCNHYCKSSAFRGIISSPTVTERTDCTLQTSFGLPQTLRDWRLQCSRDKGKAKQDPTTAQKPCKQVHTQMALEREESKSHFQHKEDSLASLLSSNGKQVHSFTCERVQKK